MSAPRPVLTLLAAAALAGCTVGPDYGSPLSKAPAQAPFAGAASPDFSAAQPPGDWWRLYSDPALETLVGQALAANTDLRVAAANLAQARAVLRETRAGRLPSTTLQAGATYGRQSAQAFGDAAPLPDTWTFDPAFDVSYQVDLFGRLTRAIQASRADAEATQAAYDLARITVVAETTRAYADACGFGRQLDVARKSQGLQQQSYDLTRRLLDAGRGTGLDVARAGALLDQTRSAVPGFEAQRKGALYRLAVLTGRPPAEISAAADACRAPPTLRTPIPVGDGAALLRRRPDVRRAERTLAAATARIGVATADLYPNVTLNASVGSTATSLAGITKDTAFTYSVGPLIQWTFPNVAVARARIAEARAGADAALATFDGAWLNALQEAETALSAYAGELDRNAALTRARDENARAADLAHQSFTAGRLSFLDVVTADRSLSDAEAALAQSDAQLATDQITLFLALGGGWQTAAPTTRAG